MEDKETIQGHGKDLFDKHADEITPAIQRAVREAMLVHKKLGNPVAVGQDDKIMILPSDEIMVD
jgi:hypothetical protein